MYGRYLFITPLCIIHLFKNVWQLGAPCLITPRMARARWSRPLAPPLTWRRGCRRLASITPDLPRIWPKTNPKPTLGRAGRPCPSLVFWGDAKDPPCPLLRIAGCRCMGLLSPQSPGWLFGVGGGDVLSSPPAWTLQ